MKTINISDSLLANNDISKLLKALIDVSIIEDDANFIAGGFARVFAHHYLGYKPFCNINDVKSYFLKEVNVTGKYVQHQMNINSDIDIFLKKNVIIDDQYIVKNNRQLQNFCDINQYVIKQTIFTKTKRAHININKTESFISFDIQYVYFEKFRSDTVKEIFDNFDIVNACYCITKSNDQYYLHYNEEAYECDVLKLVKIQNITSPFLAKRLHKYITQKGCDLGLHHDSHKKLTEWCFSIRNGIINHNHFQYLSNSLEQLKSHLDKLIDINILKNEQIVIFLNYWMTHVKRNPHADYNDADYHETIPIDWAESKI